MHVTLIAAQSIDGFITKHSEMGSEFTSPEDKVYFRAALRNFDSRVMGAGTYRATREAVRRSARPEHLQFVLTRQPAAFQNEAIPGSLEFVDLPADDLLRTLESRGYRRCALIGGSQVHRLFLEAGCVNELWLTIEPLLFGRGTPLVAGEVDLKLERISHELLSANTLLLKYRITSAG